jgi:cell division protein FtsW
MGAPTHFAVRHAIALAVGMGLGIVGARLGVQRILRAAPWLFLIALVLTVAVFLPKIGVRAGGASRWLRLGPISGNPAPLLAGATVALLASALSAVGRVGREAGIGAALAAVLLLVAEPDFSAAAVALLAGLAALVGAGVGARRLIAPALLLLLALGLGAAQFGYVGGRIAGFLSPESDRRGKGYEVLALARANAKAAKGTGLGQGSSRRQLSSPGSDYVYALVSEEFGPLGTLAVPAAWAAIAAGVVLAARNTARRSGERSMALGLGVAMSTPAALHIAVCRGWVPIIGVTMPLLSYDPGLTVATGAELGLLAAIAADGDAA